MAEQSYFSEKKNGSSLFVLINFAPEGVSSSKLVDGWSTMWQSKSCKRSHNAVVPTQLLPPGDVPSLNRYGYALIPRKNCHSWLHYSELREERNFVSPHRYCWKPQAQSTSELWNNELIILILVLSRFSKGETQTIAFKSSHDDASFAKEELFVKFRNSDADFELGNWRATLVARASWWG